MNNKIWVVVIGLVIIIALIGSDTFSLYIPQQVQFRMDDISTNNIRMAEMNEEGEICDNFVIQMSIHAEASSQKVCLPIINDALGNVGNCKANGAKDWTLGINCGQSQVACIKSISKLGNPLIVKLDGNEIFNQQIVDGQTYDLPNICSYMNNKCHNGAFISECKAELRWYANGGEATLLLKEPSSHITTDEILANELGIIDKAGDATITPPAITAPIEVIEPSISNNGSSSEVSTSSLASNWFNNFFNHIKSFFMFIWSKIT